MGGLGETAPQVHPSPISNSTVDGKRPNRSMIRNQTIGTEAASNDCNMAHYACDREDRRSKSKGSFNQDLETLYFPAALLN